MLAEERAEIEREGQSEIESYSSPRGVVVTDTFLYSLLGSVIVLVLVYIVYRVYRQTGGPQESFLWAAIAGLFLLHVALAMGWRYLSYSKERSARRQKWDAILKRGEVEILSVMARAVVGISRSDGREGWFFDVGGGKLLFLFWPRQSAFPNDSFEVRWLPAHAWVFSVRTVGSRLEPEGPPRRFKKQDYEPTQCELLTASLPRLDRDLVSLERKRQRARLREQVLAADWSGPNAGLKVLADGIEGFGFYKYVSASRKEAVKTKILEGVDSWLHASRRAVDADAEYLAECGVKDLLESLNKVLAAEGVVLTTITEQFGEGQYSILINEEEYQIYSKEEGSSRHSWRYAQDRAVGIVNELLRAAGSKERAHLMWEGEDGVVVILTPDMLSYLESSGAVPEGDLPRQIK